MNDSQRTTSRASKSPRWRVRSLLILVALLVILVWIISYSYFRHPFKNGQPLEDRLAIHAAVGEAMTITSVLFSGLGFVALIATVWFQRRQIEAAIQGMEESTKAQQENLKTLRAQSDATLAVAQISALSILIPIKQNELDVARRNSSMRISDRLTARLPALEQEQIDRMNELESLLKQVKHTREI
jgi:hypothetical protein